MPNVDLNWIAIILATVVNMVVGYIWYSPALFAHEWSKLTGRKMNEMGDGSTSYVITTVAALIQNIILAFVVGWVGVSTVANGAWLGFLLWVAFVAVTQGVNTVFAGGRKKLWAINTGYFLVVLLINGALLATWH